MKELLDTALEMSAILFLLALTFGVGTISVLIIWGYNSLSRERDNKPERKQ